MNPTKYMKPTKINANLAALSISALAAGMAQGAIVYQDINLTVDPNNTTSANFDVFGDGSDFTLGYSANNRGKPYINNTPNPNAYVFAGSNQGLPITPFGVTVNSTFLTQQTSGLLEQNGGNWPESADTFGFVGLELVSGSNTNYGWARIFLHDTGTSASTMTLVDCAYETSNNVTIITGQTNELTYPIIYTAPPALSPVSQTNAGGATITLTVDALGAPALVYQWEKGAVGSGIYSPLTDSGNVSGSSTAVLTITNASTANMGDYIVIVTNTLGMATSSPPATQVVVPLRLTGPFPATESIYSNGVARFSIGVSSTVPATIHWFFNGSGLNDGGSISGSGTTNLVVANLGGENAGIYSVVGTNIYGAVTSSVAAVLTVVPTTGEPYESAVLAAGPWAYYRLNEFANPATNPVVFDYVGAYNGVYGSDMQNGFNGISGPLPGEGFAGFSATNYAGLFAADDANGRIAAAPWNLNTNTVTMTAWINPNGVQAGSAGVVFSRGASANGINFTGSQDASGNSTLTYHWNDDSGTYNWDSGLAPIPGDWSFVALVITPTNGTIYVYDYTAGTLRSAQNAYPNPVKSFSDLSYIGDDPVVANRQFAGTIDEVAIFNRSLSPNDLLKLYAAGIGSVGGLPPTITTQPSSLELFPNTPIQLSVAVTGTSPLSYRWFISQNNSFKALTDGGGIIGSGTNFLSISNPNSSYFTNYYVIITNSAGSVTSSVAQVQLQPLSGEPYEASVAASHPAVFYEFNETTDPSSGNAIAYDYAGGYNALYGINMENGFSGLAGPQPADGFPGFSSTNLATAAFGSESANDYVTCPAWNLNSSNVTLSIWINPTAAQGGFTGLIFCRGGDTVAGLGFGPAIGVAAPLAYTWNNDAKTFNWASGLYPPSGQWSFVSLVVTPTTATIYMMNTNGVQSATHTYNHAFQSFGSPVVIGTDSASAQSRAFTGIMDDVAVYNTALSQNQLQDLYDASAGIQPPVIMQITHSAGAVQISWNPSVGVLLQSTNLTGPWVTNAAAVSPYSVAPTNAVEFYKVRVQ